MTLSIKDVEHVAKLARLELSDQDKDKFTSQLASILEYIEKLNEIDTDQVDPILNAASDENVTREDVVMPSLEHDEIMKNAPDTDNDRNFFKVKKVIE